MQCPRCVEGSGRSQASSHSGMSFSMGPEGLNVLQAPHSNVYVCGGGGGRGRER